MKYFSLYLGYSLLMLGVAMMAIGFVMQITPRAYLQSDKILLPSIVRLHDARGIFFCTGVVVSNKLIATAHHCVDRSGMFGPEILASDISVRPPSGRDIGITATTVGGFSRSDTAMITGDFSGFQKSPMIVDVDQDMKVLLNKRVKLLACGFPWGDKFYCSPITDRSFYQFAVKGKGLLFPGMSGGPVINEATGEVVGLNRAVIEGEVIISPTMSIYLNSGAKKE